MENLSIQKNTYKTKHESNYKENVRNLNYRFKVYA